MDKEIDFKALFLKFFAFVALVVYIRANYSIDDVFKFAQKKAHPVHTPRVEYYIGWYHYRGDREERAHSAWGTLLAEYPTSYYSPPALYRRGLLYRQDQKWAQARSMFEKYMEEFPEGKEIHLVNKKYEKIKYK